MRIRDKIRKKGRHRDPVDDGTELVRHLYTIPILVFKILVVVLCLHAFP